MPLKIGKEKLKMTEQEANIIIGRNIKSLLKEHDMSQVELANKIGVVPATVSAWCLGKSSPRMDKIDKIASVFSVPRSELLKDLGVPDGWKIPENSGRYKYINDRLDKDSAFFNIVNFLYAYPSDVVDRFYSIVTNAAALAYGEEKNRA